MKKLSIEDKELLLKDLSARLPYGVAISQGLYDEKPIRLNSISITSIGTFFNGYFTEGIHFTFNGEGDIWPKACLRPMSSMTEDEYKEMQMVLGGGEYAALMNKTLGLELWLESVDTDPTIWFDSLVDVQDWLNAHHFDYRGLIEKGLALEAPDGMYKLKN